MNSSTLLTDDNPSESGVQAELGDNVARVCVQNIEDLPTALNHVAECKRMLVNPNNHGQTSVNVVLRERMSIENERLETTIPGTKRKLDQERRNSSPKRVATLPTLEGQPQRQETDPFANLGWKTFNCGMWDCSKGDFPDFFFLKDSDLGEQCPGDGDFTLFPDLYCTAQGWTYKYAKCTCATADMTSKCAMVRLVCPTSPEDTAFKCFLIQVATADDDQLYCQHHGVDGGAHIAPGGEFTMEKLRNSG